MRDSKDSLHLLRPYSLFPQLPYPDFKEDSP